jgi:hypothetical protein
MKTLFLYKVVDKFCSLKLELLKMFIGVMLQSFINCIGYYSVDEHDDCKLWNGRKHSKVYATCCKNSGTSQYTSVSIITDLQVRIRNPSDVLRCVIFIRNRNSLITWNTNRLQKLMFAYLFKNSPRFTEPGGSVQHSEETAIRLYPDSIKCSPLSHYVSLS